MAGDRTFLEKVHCDVEFRTVKPDGTVKQIHGIGDPVLSPNGELVQVVGTMVDVTERSGKRPAKRELCAAEAAHIGSWVGKWLEGPLCIYRRVYRYAARSKMVCHLGTTARAGSCEDARFRDNRRAIEEQSEYDVEFRILKRVRQSDSFIPWVAYFESWENCCSSWCCDGEESKRAEEERERLRRRRISHK